MSPYHAILLRLFAEGASLTINLRVAPDSTPVHLPRSVSRASSSWSTGEPAKEGGPTSYQDVVKGRVESRQVDPEMLPPEDMPINEQSGPNIFTSNGNTPRGRGLLCDANVACISPLSPR